MNSDTQLSSVKDALNAPPSPPSTFSPPPGFPKLRAPGPITVTEALADITRQQESLKAALDRLIDDATTLRAQL
jgi:hypothetical protein